MDMTQDAANLVVNQTLMLAIEGARMMLTLTGKGAVRVAAMTAAVLQQKHKTGGEVRLSTMLRAGRNLEVFTLPIDQLKSWASAAKSYDILYTVVKDSANDGMVDLFVRAEDAARINRVVERHGLGLMPEAHIEAAPAPNQELSSPDQKPSEEWDQETDRIIEEVLAGREVVRDETSEIIGEALEQEVPDEYFDALFQNANPIADPEAPQDPQSALLSESPSAMLSDMKQNGEATQQRLSETPISQQGNEWPFQRVRDEWPLSHGKDAFTPEQRVQIYKGFEAGLSPEQVEQYAIPTASPEDMEKYRKTLRPSVKAAMNRIKQEKAAVGQAVQAIEKAVPAGKEM